ncbi:unnamed protein product [Parascedosporium putredinis]|uniref:linoleate 8R-lipoxygenase n=1 Tax=Parascedosporium putredinis TaxID=1442378 RepID=A0A9P1H8Q8_9PEZI|nr:unnamed protein product [Parascedosporium putredinis]CAI8002728.1 unnamed protein product [Parascedosporium putredinis]
MSFNEKFQAGEAYGSSQNDSTDFLSDPIALATQLVKDYAGVRSQVTPIELASLLKSMLLEKGKPIDDKKGTSELLIGILTALPSTAKIRTQLTNKLIDTLWDTLQHPPLTYVGGNVKYEVVNPQNTSAIAGAPDYDTIEFQVPGTSVTLREKIPKLRMACTIRADKALHGAKPDASLLFDLLMARDDVNFKDNEAGISSMFFYHASIIIHDIFRTSRTDMNKSDTSSYLDLAPLYGSSLKDQLEIRTMKEGRLKPDTFHEKRLLGQPAGVNVMLVLYSRFHNYVADILLKINENGRFTLACGPEASEEDRARALAKQDHDLLIRLALLSVSVEFNLLYRFHSCISKKDERWINDFFLKLFPNRTAENLDQVSMRELGEALQDFEKGIPKDPSQRTFDGLKRQADGTFKNDDLVNILKEAMEDPAGVFGSRTIPKALKIVEVLAINQARRWQVGSLNEFRTFFGLKRHEKFTDINKNPEIADILERLYTDPDMVELYPGLMIENFKPVRSAGSGICPTYSLGRAVLSDAITLVRSDRGSMLYKLIQRGLPGWFPFNSVAVMQPMYTKKANIQIAKKLGTIDQFTVDDPKPPKQPIIVTSNATAKKALSNPDTFAAPWLAGINALFPGKKDYSWFMLSALHKFIDNVGAKLIEKETFKLSQGLHQIDIIRDVAIPLNTQLLADLFYFDLRTDENPDGQFGTAELYRHLLNIRIWGVNNTDPAQAWTRRRRAQEGVKAISESTRRLVNEVTTSKGFGFGIATTISNLVGSRQHIKKDSLRWCGLKLVENLLAQGDSADRVVDNLWLTSFGGTGVPITAFYEVLDFFLKKENATIWAQVQNFAAKSDTANIHAYVIEALRLTSNQRNVRVAIKQTEIDGKVIQPGTPVVFLMGEAGRNPAEVSDATKFDPKRKVEAISPFSHGQHECFAKDIALSFITGLIKLVAGLKDLRPAQAWKLHFCGKGTGNFQGDNAPNRPIDLQQYYYLIQKRKGA